ncbi:MAG TPA: hypothetical protein PLF48_01680 [Chitinophagales bacterium]|nr:hypothetical protein [Chitinophagales bacterium]
MKKHTFRLSIDEPCLENWADMSQTEQGAFCAVCQKEVIDFSDKTSSEIAAFFSQKKEKTCGRFLKRQLEETYVIYPPYRHSKFKYAAGLALGLMSTQLSHAQDSIDKNPKVVIEKSEPISTKNVDTDTIKTNIYESNINKTKPIIARHLIGRVCIQPVHDSDDVYNNWYKTRIIRRKKR